MWDFGDYGGGCGAPTALFSRRWRTQPIRAGLNSVTPMAFGGRATQGRGAGVTDMGAEGKEDRNVQEMKKAKEVKEIEEEARSRKTEEQQEAEKDDGGES